MPSPARSPAPTAAAAAVSAPALSDRWFFGRWSDLLLGCGLWYAAAFVAMSFAGESIQAALPFAMALLPINLVSSAHYGATALRAYERTEDRRTYALFTLWTTLVLGACFVAGLASAEAGSWFVTVYLTWSPWHYALQNFGIAMAFLRRRGIEVTPLARRLLHASFVLSFVLAALALHATAPRASYAPNELGSGDYSFLALGPRFGLPGGVADALLATAAAVYVVVTSAAFVVLSRKTTLRDAFPALALVATQALWFSVPVAARHWDVLTGLAPLAADHATYAFLWIGAGHAAQYLWITSYFARRAGRSSSHAGFLTRSLLAGTALWTVPALLFAPGLLGRLPYDAGLALMVAALVNLHHFVLDGVIWKLRDARIARILLVRSGAPADAPAPAMRPWVRTALWTSGTALLVWGAATALLTEFGFNRALRRGDLDAARRASERLDLLVQASAERPLQIGQRALESGDVVAARRNLERSLEVLPTAWAWVGIGDLHARRGAWTEAADAYGRALALEPDHAVANFNAGLVSLEQGHLERGRRALLKARASILANPEGASPGFLETVDQTLGELDAAEPAPARPAPRRP